GWVATESTTEVTAANLWVFFSNADFAMSAKFQLMVLSQEELRSLIEVNNRSPHQLLGMHPLGDGSGVVVRALVPNAAKVEVHPVHEKDKPTIKLERIPNSDVWEGVSKTVKQVYAYDLVTTSKNKLTGRGRDPYSFLPTLGESDLYLFGKG